MAESVLSKKNDSPKKQGEAPVWIGAVAIVVMIVAIGCTIGALFGGGSSGSGGDTNSSTDEGNTASKQSALEDECILKAQANVKDKNIKVTTITGLVDGDSTTVGKNKNGDPMTLYRWYGEKDGKKVMFACYAAIDSSGNIGVASVSMDLNLIYENKKYDFAE
jgi:hypothetical protein